MENLINASYKIGNTNDRDKVSLFKSIHNGKLLIKFVGDIDYTDNENGSIFYADDIDEIICSLSAIKTLLQS